MLFLAVFAVLMPEAVTLAVSLSVPKDRLSFKRVAALLLTTSAINLSLFLFMQYPLTHSLNIRDFAKRIIAFEYTYRSAGSFVFITGIALLLGLALGFLLQSAIIDAAPSVNLRLGWVFAAALICWGVIFGITEGMKKDSDGRLSIIAADHEFRHIVNDKPVISDRVMLVNAGKLSYDLNGMFLTNDEDNRFKMPLEAHTMASGERLPVYTDEYFSNGAGATVYLCDAKGNVICSFDPLSPDKPEKPVLSAESGFYDGEFELSMTAGEGERIFYSLDGSDPAEHGMLYEAPVPVYDKSAEPAVLKAYPRTHYDWQYEPVKEAEPVDRCFTVKAVAIDEAGRVSDTVTGIYFIDKPDYDGMVVSITANADDLFGDYGICVTGKAYDEWALSGGTSNAPQANFMKTGREWEVPGTIDVFDGKKYISGEKAGLRVQGGSSRLYGIKRFSLYSRREYGGSDYFATDFFDDGSKVHSAVLRPSEVNAIFPLLVEDRDALGIRSVPVTIFLNGEYWYETWLGEKYSAYYFNSHFGIGMDNLITVKSEELDEGNQRDYQSYQELFDYIEGHDLSNDSDYREFCGMLDMQSYIDCNCINLYAVNLDGDDITNSFVWRTREPEEGHKYADGKWRYSLYDMDALDWVNPDDYGVETRAEINTFTAQPPHEEILPYNEHVIFEALMGNKDFRKQFVLSYMDIINTDFSEKKVSSVLSEFGFDMSWHDSFFVERPKYAVEHLAEEFALEGTAEELTIKTNEPSGGTVRVNTACADLASGTWKGKYFTDYPVEISVECNPGWRFAGFGGDIKGGGTSASVELKPGGTGITLAFEKEQ